MKSEIIKTFLNEEDGIKSYVTIHEKGFCVSVQDVDSGEYLDTHFIYQDKNDAINKAMEIL